MRAAIIACTSIAPRAQLSKKLRPTGGRCRVFVTCNDIIFNVASELTEAAMLLDCGDLVKDGEEMK